MSTQTSHYNLVKPAGSEAYDVGVQNSNMELIDAAMWGSPATYKGALTSSDDANSLADGIYYLANNLPQNVPSDATYCFLIQIKNSYIKQQIIIKPYNGSVWMREYSGTPTWQAWTPIVPNWKAGSIADGITYKTYGKIVTIYINNVSVSTSSAWSSLGTLPNEIRSPYSVHTLDVNGVGLRVSGNALDYRGNAASLYGIITYVL